MFQLIPMDFSHCVDNVDISVYKSFFRVFPTEKVEKVIHISTLSIPGEKTAFDFVQVTQKRVSRQKSTSTKLNHILSFVTSCVISSTIPPGKA